MRTTGFDFLWEVYFVIRAIETTTSYLIRHICLMLEKQPGNLDDIQLPQYLFHWGFFFIAVEHVWRQIYLTKIFIFSTLSDLLGGYLDQLLMYSIVLYSIA